jgi:hypothetical protein
MLDRASGDVGSSDEEPDEAEVVAGAIQHVGPPSVAGTEDGAGKGMVPDRRRGVERITTAR